MKRNRHPHAVFQNPESSKERIQTQMSNSKANLHTRPLAVIALTISVALVAFVGATGAANAAAPAKPITLDWTQVKVYDSPQVVPNTNRTWLGYLTRGGAGPQYAKGTLTPSDGLAGPTVTPDSPAGSTALYSWIFNSTKSTFGATRFAGTIDFGGTLTYDSPAPPTGHGIKIAISNPKIVITKDGQGFLLASGSGLSAASTGGADYTTYSNLGIFALDLSKATCTVSADGTTSLVGISPSLGAAGFFTKSYPVGSGPERTPNTYGTFALNNLPCAYGGKIAVVGANGKPAITKTYVAKRPAFKRTSRPVAVKVTRKKKFIGYAVVTGKRVKLTTSVAKIKGTYKLSPTEKSYKPVKLKLR